MNALLRAVLPGWRGEAVPRSFPVSVRLALRLSVAVVWLAALRWTARPFSWLDDARREAVLARLATHRWSALRGLVSWWKLVALCGADEAEP